MTAKNGRDDPRVASLDEARRRAAEKSKAAKQAGKQSWTGPNPGPEGPRTMRDLIVGGVIIAMAIGLVVSFVMSVTKVTVETPATKSAPEAVQ